MKTLIGLTVTILLVFSGCVTTSSTTPTTPIASSLQQEGKLRVLPTSLPPGLRDKMIVKHNLYDASLNETGGFANDFSDNGDGTVTDKATGLMWEQGGTVSLLAYYEAQKYVEQLDLDRFSGHNDWRIPTLEELCTLLEREENATGMHIAPIFKPDQKICWSSDFVLDGENIKYGTPHDYQVAANFLAGETEYVATRGCSAGRGGCFVRAVRTENK